MPNGDKSQARLDPSLQEKLNAYHASIESEFSAAEAAAISGEDFEKLVRDTFKEQAPHACARIIWLSQNAESEATQLKAAQVVLLEAFKAAALEGDPIRKLLDELSSNDPNERKSSKNKSSKIS
jgi:hypothetical protein